MTIAVHISFSNSQDGFLKNFNYRCCTILAAQHPQHHFIFIFDKSYDPSLIKEKNITPVLLNPEIKNRLLAHYWYNFKIPALLNKFNATVFISDKINVCFRTAIKQCLVLNDLSFMQKENFFSKGDNRYLKRYFKKIVAKTDCIAVTNNNSSIELAKIFPFAKDKLKTVGFGLNDAIKNNQLTDIQNIKEKYTGGKEYFIAYITDVSVSNTTLLLKSFSAFKKRQLSNMQLLLVITTTQKENPVKDFETYKYRNEVKIIVPEGEDELAEVTAGAYAAIYLPAMEITEDKGLLALKHNIPLVTIGNEFSKNIYNDGALYVKTTETNIAEKIMLLYKNENLRNDLANTGKLIANIYSWNNTAANLWQALLHTTEK